MSTSIELLDSGCTGIQLINKINEIIAALNNVEQTTDYNQLTNRPSINGVTLSGNKTTNALLLALADATDYATVMAALATKTEVNAVISDATSAATAAANALLAGKVDANPANVKEATLFNENAFIYIYTDNGLRKVKVSSLSDNIAIRSVSKDNLEKAVNSQLSMLTVTGDQDGKNTSYEVDSKYIHGTSNLYLNGQRLVLGTDYMEIPLGFVMLSRAPEVSDSLIFIAAIK
ncbi:MAG: hypothetical protein J5644_03760 [Bacteroidales bacterium]|nr:hypothetical protein [Bacteroidales bacterium]